MRRRGRGWRAWSEPRGSAPTKAKEGPGMAVTLAATRESSPFRASRKPPLMEKFVIQGGVPLSGTVRPAGNKNAALPLLAAAVLTTEPVVLRNVPRISDVGTMLDLVRDLGGSAEWRGDNEVLVDAS